MPNAFPRLIPTHTGHFPDRISLQQGTEVPERRFGQPTVTYTNVADLTNLRCRVTPASLTEQMESAERRFDDGTELRELARVAIPQYLPTVAPSMRASVELHRSDYAYEAPTTWNVRGVQTEPHVNLTRLLIERVSP